MRTLNKFVMAAGATCALSAGALAGASAEESASQPDTTASSYSAVDNARVDAPATIRQALSDARIQGAVQTVAQKFADGTEVYAGRIGAGDYALVMHRPESRFSTVVLTPAKFVQSEAGSFVASQAAGSQTARVAVLVPDGVTSVRVERPGAEGTTVPVADNLALATVAPDSLVSYQFEGDERKLTPLVGG